MLRMADCRGDSRQETFWALAIPIRAARAVFLICFCLLVSPDSALAEEYFHAIAIHGGAGTITREQMTPEREQAFHSALKVALFTGDSVLAGGGTATDAVVAAIITMEDSPLFNAGKGAVFTRAGTNELDASIMHGADLQAGGVAAVRHVKNPIVLARAVMEHSPHVFMIGAGAEEFAREQEIELVDSSYFFTERRWQQLQKAREKSAKEGG